MNEFYREIKRKDSKDYDPEIIAWEREKFEDKDRSLTYKYPKSGDSIKEKNYFAVKDYEKAIFYNKGALIGVLKGGVYELDKKAKIKGTEIVWIDTSFIDIQWGIPQSEGIPTKDGYIIGIHGDLKLMINDVRTFYNDVVAGKKDWSTKNLKDFIMSLLQTSMRDMFKSYEAKSVILEDRKRVINLLTSKVTEEFLRYGIELETLNIIGIKPPEGTEKLFELDKEKAKTIEDDKKSDLELLLQNKNEIQERIQDLNNKLKDQQDLLLNDEISQEEFKRKEEQIKTFIIESEKELDEINKKIT